MEMRQVADMRKAILLVVVIVTAVSSVAYANMERKYYESGQLKSEVRIKDGKNNGIGKNYYESGQVKAEVNYKDGKQEGIRKAY